MKFYELTYLLPSKFTEQEVNNFSAKIISFIQEKKGVLAENPSIKEGLAKRKLVLSIKKEGQGYLASLNFYLDPQEIKALKTKLSSENQVLRCLILAKKPFKERKVSKILPQIPKIKREIKPPLEKVDLKEIEKKLEEILEE